MLVDPRFKPEEPIDMEHIKNVSKESGISVETFLSTIEKGKPRKLETGVYTGYRFEEKLDHKVFNLYKYCDEVGLGKALRHEMAKVSQYGTADDLDQIKHYYRKQIGYKTRNYCIHVTLIENDCDEYPRGGGFRWHKNGPYIGKHKHLGEHLAETPEIKEVLLFHIYRLMD